MPGESIAGILSQFDRLKEPSAPARIEVARSLAFNLPYPNMEIDIFIILASIELKDCQVSALR